MILDLSAANLVDANLSGANLSGANLRGGNLSGAKNLVTSSEFLKQFESDESGMLVFRAQRGSYVPPSHWIFEAGKFPTETVNPDRCTECGCGVSFATRKWIAANHSSEPVWLCRINWIDLADVVVPFGTDGKARCARLELIKIVT